MPRTQRHTTFNFRRRKYDRNRPKKKCPVCDKLIGAANYTAHGRRKHPNQLKEMGIKEKRHKYHGHPYRFIASMVSNCMLMDKKITNQDEKYVITLEIISKLKKKGQLDPSLNNLPCRDDCGGYLKEGFDFHSYSLYKLSLDRINNSIGHFNFKNGTWLSNIRFVVHGINHRTNPTRYNEKMPSMLRDKVMQQVDPNEVYTLKIRLKKTVYNKLQTLPYKSILCAYHRDGKNHFNSAKEMRLYCFGLLREQWFRCKISNIFMNDTHDNSEAGHRMFAPSLNAIDPVKGHRKGNLEWICSFLNNSNFDKTKTDTFEDDKPTSWNRERFYGYIGFKV